MLRPAWMAGGLQLHRQGALGPKQRSKAHGVGFGQPVGSLNHPRVHPNHPRPQLLAPICCSLGGLPVVWLLRLKKSASYERMVRFLAGFFGVEPIRPGSRRLMSDGHIIIYI